MEAAIPPRISVITPTLHRPQEVSGLLANLCEQTVLPFEIVLVDGAPEEKATQETVQAIVDDLPYHCQYIRRGGGTAIQRNVGIDAASGDYFAFIDDDIRLEPDFFAILLEDLVIDSTSKIGGIAGYITNQHRDPNTNARRWIWFRRLKLYTTYEPGRYDYETGYPISRYLQPPHTTLREIDFMGTNCALWRRAVLDEGLRFDEFFSGYGVLEDAHFALRAKQNGWELWEDGKAHCIHDHAPGGRENHRSVARKTAINYRYVFIDIVPNRTARNEIRFWRVQFFDLFRFALIFIRRPSRVAWDTMVGKFEGIIAAMKMHTSKQ